MVMVYTMTVMCTSVHLHHLDPLIKSPEQIYTSRNMLCCGECTSSVKCAVYVYVDMHVICLGY